MRMTASFLPTTSSLVAPRQSPRTVETSVEWVLLVLLPVASLVVVGLRPRPGAGLAVGHPQGVALAPARTVRGCSDRSRRRISGGLRWVLAQGAFVVDRAANAQRGVPPVAVVLLDPAGDPGPGVSLGGELLEPAQLELQGGVPGLDDRVVQRRAGPAHRLADAAAGAGGAERPGGVL